MRTSQLRLVADRRFDVVDLTDDVDRIVQEAGLDTGVVWVFCRHTTCGVFINELESGLIQDLGEHLSRLVPLGYFAHDDLSRRTQNLQGPDEPANGAAHIRQILFGATAQMVPVLEGRLGLGTWQRILFVELDEPRPRDLLVTTLG